MKQLNASGALNALLIPLILVVLLFFGAAGFGVWAFMERQDYKDNVDQKIATAVEVAREEVSTEKDNEFLEREKEPLTEYVAPAAYGSVFVKYPKTWSAYVSELGNSGREVDGYFHPDFVPATESKTAYALRLLIASGDYAEEVADYDRQVEAGTLSSTPYRAPKVPDVLGVRLDGELEKGIQGTMIMLPLRDKVIKIWTESAEYRKDLENHVLSNLTFVP